MISVILVLMIVSLISQNGLAKNDKLVTVQVRRVEITDVLTMITDQLGINMVPDETVKGKVSLNLKEVELKQVLEVLNKVYGYRFNQVSKKIYLVSKKQPKDKIKARVKNNQLTLHVQKREIRKVLKKISKQADINLIMDDKVTGVVSIDFESVPLDLGLINLLQANGFSLSKSNNIYRVNKAGDNKRDNNLSVSVVDGKVSIDVKGANIVKVLRNMFSLADKDMVLFGQLRGRIDLKLKKVSIEEALDILLSGTRFTYRKKEGRYYIGDKNPNNPASSLFTVTKLIPIEHVKVTQVPKLLPNSTRNVEVKVLKKQNAILATGTTQDIKNLKSCISRIDRKIPQIVVDALIIEVSRNNQQDPMYKLGMDYDNEDGTTSFDSSLGKLTYKSVLDLPSDFYLKIQSLVNKGQATIKANPNITTLNGQEANINVGMVQYYKTTRYDEDDNTEVDEYQSVDAGVNLSVTPWVGSSGEINLELEPSVSNISGASAEGPPEISEREVSTNVRVKDGETIVIGGLIQDVGSESVSKVPVLGDIPILGRLFISENNDVDKRELIIYITPHILGNQSQKAEESKKKMLEKANQRIEDK